MARLAWFVAGILALLSPKTGAVRIDTPLSPEAAQWVDSTFASMTPEEKAGQVIIAGTLTNYASSDSDRNEDYPGAELAAVRAVLGEIPFRGRLPVTLPDLYPAGHGIQH